jgi:SAM-dependent methyltransferase
MDSFHEADVNADLGLPIPRGTRFRFLKRLLARLFWLTNHRQVAFNHQVLELVRDVDRRLQLGPAGPVLIDQVFAEQLSRVRSELAVLSGAHAVLESGQLRSDAQVDGLGVRLERAANDLVALGSHLAGLEHALDQFVQQQRLTASLRQLSERVPSRVADEQGDVPAIPTQESRPELHAAIHEVFRGPPDEVRRRLEVYLPAFEACRGGRVLDLGAGRGELLELLAASGIDAYGVDLNPIFVERCRGRGLEVLEGDAVSHLAKLPDASMAGIAALHVVEHLPFETLVDLLDHSLRVLEPGGLLVVETPNPTNLVVGASTFYLDPTHRQPIHPELLRILLVARGYVDVELRFLHPDDALLEPPASGRNPTDAVVRCLNQQLFGPRDVGAIARRPDQ